MCEPLKPRNEVPRVKRICGGFRECRAAQITAKANVDTAALELIGVELPGVVEDGMSGRNGQRKPGTAYMITLSSRGSAHFFFALFVPPSFCSIRAPILSSRPWRVSERGRARSLKDGRVSAAR